MKCYNLSFGFLCIFWAWSLASCSGGSSSGADRDEPPEIELLAQQDRDYVRRWVGQYVYGLRVTHVHPASCTVVLGDVYNQADALYRAAILVHEASHCANNDPPCCPACERRASGRAADALDRINRTSEASVWRGFDGNHQAC